MDHILFRLFRCVVAQFSWCVSGTCLNGMQFQCADSDGSRNKFMESFLLLLLHLAPPSLVLRPQICRGALEGLHWISSGMGARAPSAPPLDPSLVYGSVEVSLERKQVNAKLQNFFFAKIHVPACPWTAGFSRSFGWEFRGGASCGGVFLLLQYIILSSYTEKSSKEDRITTWSNDWIRTTGTTERRTTRTSAAKGNRVYCRMEGRAKQRL